MTDLAALKTAADMAGKRFDDACRPHFCDGRWGAYRAIECNKSVPKAVTDAMDEYIAATHAFYLARDGEHGFLGPRSRP